MEGKAPASFLVGQRCIPIYSLRDRRQHGFLARALAQGMAAAFQAGPFGLVRAARRHSLLPRSAESRSLHGPRSDPTLWLSPRGAIPLIAAERIHPAFQLPDDYLSLFAALSAPLQVVAPLRLFGPPSVRKLADPLDRAEEEVEEPAGAYPVRLALLWMHDLAWMALADLLALYGPDAPFYTFSPLPHAERLPVFTLEELIRRTRLARRAPFDLVIHDPALEATGAASLPTRIGLPGPDEEPALTLLRQGGVSADWLAEATGWPIRIAPGAQPGRRTGGLSDHDLRLRLDRPWQQW